MAIHQVVDNQQLIGVRAVPGGSGNLYKDEIEGLVWDNTEELTGSNEDISGACTLSGTEPEERSARRYSPSTKHVTAQVGVTPRKRAIREL